MAKSNNLILYCKYSKVIDDVSALNNADVFVAEAMIASVCRIRTSEIEGEELYKGVPADFDCEGYLEDYELYR